MTECVQMKPGETVGLVTDQERLSGLGSSLWEGAASLGYPLLLRLPEGCRELERHTPLLAALQGCDIVIVLTSYLFPRSLRRRALEAGARLLSLCGVTEAMVPAIDVDYWDLYRRTQEAGFVVRKSRRWHVTSPAGTDLRLELAGPVTVLDGRAWERGSWTALPAGVVGAVVAPGTAAGTVVIDGSIHGLGLVDEPVRLEVKHGRIVDVAGGWHAQRLRDLLARAGGDLTQADNAASALAEVGFGTNAAATYCGNLIQDERVAGSVHVGLGDNVHLGGTNSAPLHVDVCLRRPTVFVDDVIIIHEGHLLLGGRDAR